MTAPLAERVAAGLARPVEPAVAQFAAWLAQARGALAVLFYGSNLRTGSLDGVLDYYVLTAGPPERGIWPRVSYHEWSHEGTILRAKVATMTLAGFGDAAAGKTLDTTIWARFCQPCALVWCSDAASGLAARDAVAAAIATAARLAAALGPPHGTPDDYWRALFRQTYAAEFRVESTGREDAILSVNREHFSGLLPLALQAGVVAFTAAKDGVIEPAIRPAERRRVIGWWRKRRRLGKAYNLVRLARAASTFEGAARYAAWKIERHTGIAVPLTPWREAHPLLAAPGVLLHVWRSKARRT